MQKSRITIYQYISDNYIHITFLITLDLVYICNELSPISSSLFLSFSLSLFHLSLSLSLYLYFYLYLSVSPFLSHLSRNNLRYFICHSALRTYSIRPISMLAAIPRPHILADTVLCRHVLRIVIFENCIHSSTNVTLRSNPPSSFPLPSFSFRDP